MPGVEPSRQRPHVSQVAEAAFDCHVELQACRRCRRSRDHLAAGLVEAGFRLVSPAEGAFYLSADVSERSNESATLRARMLAEARAALAPGAE